MQVVKLNNPIMVNGEEVKEVKLDFEAIRGKDLIVAERKCAKWATQLRLCFCPWIFRRW